MNTSRSRPGPSRRPARQPDPSPRRAAAKAHTPPSAAACRLLSALAEPGAVGRPDPIRDGFVSVRGGGTISLGRGHHRIAVAEELVSHDLAAARIESGRPITYAITPAGQLHLRRAAAGSDDPFQAQHREMVPGVVAGEDGPERVAVNAAESPLDWLRRRKGRDGEPLIDAASYEAGERLRRDLTFGGILPSVTARWEGGGIGQGGAGLRDPAAATDATIAARQRVRLALDAVGSDYADLLVDLCGFLKGIETIERERGWPPRSAKVVIGLALRRLAEHYGLRGQARGPGSSRGIRAWQAEEGRAAEG
jgi:hypothetical protein